MRICVTGASGKAGRATVAELLEHGHEVCATDVAPPPADLGVDLLRADLTDYGQTIEALHGCDAVVHLANIPAPGLRTPAVTFTANTAMNSNVFLAAAQLGLRRVVWASSETTLGLPFDTPPRYAPVDEDHYPLPTSTYALSKVVGETMAGHVAQWSGVPFVALRFSNIFQPEEYASLRTAWQDAAARRWNLWGYIDVRDVAYACRLAPRRPGPGRSCLHHRGRRHGDAATLRGTAERGLSRRPAHQGRGRVRHPARHRPRQGRAGLDAALLMA